MKYFILIAATVFMTACNNNEEKLAQSNREKDSILQIANENEQSVNQLITSFNDIERNLDSVAFKQHIISNSSSKNPAELKFDQKARINEQIAAINKLMLENNQKITDLKRKLVKAGKKNHHLEETIATLNNQLVQKNIELDLLNAKLNSLDLQVAQLQTSVDTLTGQNLAQSQTIKDNITALHTAFYVIGNVKDLQEAKLIDRKGGLLGIGRTATLSGDLDVNKFTKIDYTQTTNIPINSNGVKIITTHPADSYTLDLDDKDKHLVKNLVISDPQKFWSASKYLVITKG